MKSWANLFIST